MPKKTRKHLPVDEDEAFQREITVFNYHTEWDQIFRSEKDRQSTLDKSIALFRKAVDRYIDSRIKSIQGASIHSSRSFS
jgi:hypothetical protein